MNVELEFKNRPIEECLEIIGRNCYPWLAKRLSGNDTGLTGGHQAGVYLPRYFVESVLPELNTVERRNPDATFSKCYFPRDDYTASELRAIYYNSKLVPQVDQKNTRNEFRLTRWGGSGSPVQQIERTGSIWFFAVVRTDSDLQAICWVSDSLKEEDAIENWIGREIEPKLFYSSVSGRTRPDDERILPAEWHEIFPTGSEIFREVIQRCPRDSWKKPIDDLLLKRREIEFKIFEALERSHVLPKLKVGFDTVDAFVSLAHSVTNRRKSRAGTSLELNLEILFHDEKLRFETQQKTEGKKKPDFLFPGLKEYRDPNFCGQHLHMLAAKTCCKDRWRQVVTEAARIEPKHLFTLQEGVSGHQLQEMQDDGVQLVVPRTHVEKFPQDWRSRLLTLTDFVCVVRKSQSGQ